MGFCGSTPRARLNRYDGYQFKSYRRDPAHPNYPAGAVYPIILQGPVRVSLGQLQRISRSVRSCDRNLDPLSRSTTTVRTVFSGRSGT